MHHAFITDTDHDDQREAFVEMYVRIFAAPPYNEKIDPEDAGKLFDLYRSGKFLGLFDGEKLVGFGAAIKLSAAQGTPCEKYVKPFLDYFSTETGNDARDIWCCIDAAVEAHYRHHRCLKAFFEEALNAIESDRNIAIIATAADNNRDAIRLYERFGFFAIPRIKGSVEDDGGEKVPYLYRVKNSGLICHTPKIFVPLTAARRYKL